MFASAACILKERGAYKIYVMATHGLLSADAPRVIEESPIDEVSLVAGGTISLRIHLRMLQMRQNSIRCL